MKVFLAIETSCIADELTLFVAVGRTPYSSMSVFTMCKCPADAAQ